MERAESQCSSTWMYAAFVVGTTGAIAAISLHKYWAAVEQYTQEMAQRTKDLAQYQTVTNYTNPIRGLHLKYVEGVFGEIENAVKGAERSVAKVECQITTPWAFWQGLSSDALSGIESAARELGLTLDDAFHHFMGEAPMPTAKRPSLFGPDQPDFGNVVFLTCFTFALTASASLPWALTAGGRSRI